MRVLLVDDNRLMLEGLQNLLEAHDIEVAGMVSDGRQSIDLARKLKPDVILMDIRMPGCDGLAATRAIKAEMADVRIIILTTSNEDDDLFEAIKSGACGYLLKSMDTDGLIEALEQVQQGTPPFSPGLAAKILNEFARIGHPKEPVSSQTATETVEPASGGMLNSRQIEVLKMVADGLSYKEVGARLHLSPRTIKYHMAEIMNRLHLENRALVLAYAGQMGLVPKSQ
jgi:two-component system NarL family response regulator